MDDKWERKRGEQLFLMGITVEEGLQQRSVRYSVVGALASCENFEKIFFPPRDLFR